MIQKNRKTLTLTSVIILLPILAGIILWSRLPDLLPIHWNAAGEVDGWSKKPFVVFGMPLILLAIQWICVLGSLADPKKDRHPVKILQLMFWIIPVLSLVLFAIIYAVTLGLAVRIEIILPLLFGLLFIIIGNYMPKCRQNFTIGIKIPWTLSSEENWNRTHRFAGRLWVGCGFVIMLTSFMGSIWVFLALTLLMVLIPLLYSYLLFRKGI